MPLRRLGREGDMVPVAGSILDCLVCKGRESASGSSDVWMVRRSPVVGRVSKESIMMRTLHGTPSVTVSLSVPSSKCKSPPREREISCCGPRRRRCLRRGAGTCQDRCLREPGTPRTTSTRVIGGDASALMPPRLATRAATNRNTERVFRVAFILASSFSSVVGLEHPHQILCRFLSFRARKGLHPARLIRRARQSRTRENTPPTSRTLARLRGLVLAR